MEALLQTIQQILLLPANLISQLDFIPDFIKDALVMCVRVIPWLYFLYFAIELLERFFLTHINTFLKLCNKLGALFGATLSVVPECGYQVLASTLYARKMITRGTLLAFYISCSDEALPLLLMDITKAGAIIPLVVIKFVLGVVVGLGADLIFVFNQKIEKVNAVNMDINEPACCHHKLMTVQNPPYWWVHPILHTFNVFIFAFLSILLINCAAMNLGGYSNVATALFIDSPVQVIAGAIFGLIPNSVTSIFLAVAFVKGIISFPTLLAGLTSSTGIGLYALSKYYKKDTDSTFIIILLIAAAIGIGLFAYYNNGLMSYVQQLLH